MKTLSVCAGIALIQLLGACSSTPSIYNYVPNKPPTQLEVYGPRHGYTDTPLSFTVSAIDVNGDDLRFYFEWGDSSQTDGYTREVYASGDKATVYHTWTKPGNYKVTITAVDAFMATSPKVTLEIAVLRPK